MTPSEIDTFEVNGERLLVEPTEAETTRDSGLIIPDNAAEKPSRGVVRAVGDKLTVEHEHETKIGYGVRVWRVGQEVVYSKYGGVKLELDGTEFVVLTDHDVLLVRDPA